LLETSPIDLSINASANKTNINPGDSIVFTIVLSNNGIDNADNAAFYEVLPASIEHSTWTCVALGEAICTPSGTGEISDLVYIANDGSTLTYTITATLRANEVMRAPYQAFIESTEPQFDTDLSNNAAQISTTSIIYSNGFE